MSQEARALVRQRTQFKTTITEDGEVFMYWRSCQSGMVALIFCCRVYLFYRMQISSFGTGNPNELTM